MSEGPTLEAIRARVANASSVLWQLHGPRDLAWMLERYDAAVARLAELEAAASAKAPARDLSALSKRERDVVEGLHRGTRLSALARELCISQHTARNHCKHIFRKLGVRSQVELLALVGGTRG